MAGHAGSFPKSPQRVPVAAFYLISWCPYTMPAKKILRFMRNETGTPPIGSTICPIFWLSLLAGARGDKLMFKAIHSFLVLPVRPRIRDRIPDPAGKGIRRREPLMHPGLKVFAPGIAGTGLLLIANAAIKDEGWLVHTAVIAGTALTIAGIIILTSGKQKT